jgi:uncharacterized protein YbaR (Trm112 family)
MSLYDILACPTCLARVERQPESLRCPACGRQYPIVRGVPVMFPDGRVPVIQHESELVVRHEYLPWVHRVILQSLLDNQVVLDIGSGNMAFDDQCIIRMDVTWSPYVDLVADAHALPFLPGSLDYIFSLAVIEHLRNPFQAAQSMYQALKDGGFIYHECNFVFAYHGYPHHYFNASLQGLEQVFAQFTALRTGVAPYQMPSFALEMVLGSYLRHSHALEFRHGRGLARQLEQVLARDLMAYDVYFSEAEALNVAAGTYFSGLKKSTRATSLVPAIIQNVWAEHPELRQRFPDLNQLTTTDNILTWARGEGQRQFPEIAACLAEVAPFNKREPGAAWNRAVLRAWPLIEPRFGAIGVDPALSMAEQSRSATGKARRLTGLAVRLDIARTVLRQEGPLMLIWRTLQFVWRQVANR